MANDPRPFNVKNEGSPDMHVIQQTVTRVGTNKTVQKFTIPKNMGPANNPKRK